MEYKGVEYLRRKLGRKEGRVKRRYQYYEMKQVVRDFGISTPPELKYFMGTLGWCAMAVDRLADRLQFRGFQDDNFDLMAIYRMNNPDVLFDSAVLGALISSCDFIYIYPDGNGYPRMEVIDGKNGTGVMDPGTGLLSEGYAVLERDKGGTPTVEAWFTAESTVIYREGREAEVYDNPAPYPLLVPIVYRPDADRPFGHARISRACMDIMEAAIRTIKRSEIAAEFYSFPQKYVTGLSPDAEMLDKWQATMSAMMAFDKDEDGDHPTLGQFQQQSMEPHMSQLRMLASLFAGETGLTIDDLGFATENPSSSEAIKAAHENLRLTARKAQRTFGTGFLNAGYLAACVRDNYAYERRAVYMTRPQWEPLFEPDLTALSGLGDGIQKINMAVPGYLGGDNLRDILGLERSQEPVTYNG